MKCIIVDDERHSLKTTSMFLDLIQKDIEVVGSAEDAIEGAKLINEHNPDFIIVDVQMPKVSGIEMISLIPAFTGEIIFLTAHNQYAVEAFKRGAIHYLLKPLDPDDLLEAIERVEQRIKANLKDTSGKWLSMSTQNEWKVVRKQDIVRCEAQANYTTIYLKEEKHILSKSLKEVEISISSTDYYRVHASHLINIEHISKILKVDGGSVLMANGDSVPIAKSRKKDFLEWFQERVSNI